MAPNAGAVSTPCTGGVGVGCSLSDTFTVSPIAQTGTNERGPNQSQGTVRGLFVASSPLRWPSWSGPSGAGERRRPVRGGESLRRIRNPVAPPEDGAVRCRPFRRLRPRRRPCRRPSSRPASSSSLPASAYPEPFTRGLYGGPAVAGHAGAAMAVSAPDRRRDFGIRLDRRERPPDSQRQPSIPPKTYELLDQGRFLLRVTPDVRATAPGSCRRKPSSWPTRTSTTFRGPTGRRTASCRLTTSGSGRERCRPGTCTVGRFQAFDVYPLGWAWI